MPKYFTIYFSSSDAFNDPRAAAAATLLFERTTQKVYLKNTFHQVPDSDDQVQFTQTLLRKASDTQVCFLVVGDKVYGEGSFGQVVSVPFYFYLTEKLQLQRSNYVVKIQRAHPETHEEARSFNRRYGVYLSMEDDGRHYMVMNYLGESLEYCHIATRAFEERAAISLALANELQRVHQTGKIHRDLKPQNILYDKKRHVVFIIDDGLAISLEELNRSPDKRRAGTPTYIAPELFSRSAVITFASDIYSLAGVFADIWGAKSSLHYKDPYYRAHDRASWERMAKERFSLSGYLTNFPLSESPYLLAFDLPKALIYLINAMQDPAPEERVSLEFIFRFFALIPQLKHVYEEFDAPFREAMKRLVALMRPVATAEFIVLLEQESLSFAKIGLVKARLNQDATIFKRESDSFWQVFSFLLKSFFESFELINHYDRTAHSFTDAPLDLTYDVEKLQKLEEKIQEFLLLFEQMKALRSQLPVVFLKETQFEHLYVEFLRQHWMSAASFSADILAIGNQRVRFYSDFREEVRRVIGCIAPIFRSEIFLLQGSQTVQEMLEIVGTRLQLYYAHSRRAQLFLTLLPILRGLFAQYQEADRQLWHDVSAQERIETALRRTKQFVDLIISLLQFYKQEKPGRALITILLPEMQDILNTAFMTPTDSRFPPAQFRTNVERYYRVYSQFCALFQQSIGNIRFVLNCFQPLDVLPLLSTINHQTLLPLQKLEEIKNFLHHHELYLHHDERYEQFRSFAQTVRNFFSTYRYFSFKEYYAASSECDPFQLAQLRQLNRELLATVEFCRLTAENLHRVKARIDQEGFRSLQNAGIVQMRGIIGQGGSIFFQMRELRRVAQSRLEHPLSFLFEHGLFSPKRPSSVHNFYQELARDRLICGFCQF